MKSAFGKKMDLSEFEADDLAQDKTEIFHLAKSMAFREKIRHTALSCYIKCGGMSKLQKDIAVVPYSLGADTIEEACFGDCLNVNFEKGPFLSMMGEVPEDAIPKKFIWGHGHKVDLGIPKPELHEREE
uniref:Uncharacterized protein n=1 Tax=Strombidium inclinatum TaxID=197538 RepID=A0A7S3N0M3_9SPIT|mmetsp:Transcript_29929/g.45771  ORF Transcript_29929/g.45771 Transcript_29929/m.45771 type:complete len:129 (+) Transcript_29929:19-405(+)|eukprot:CAMPEP_0170491778 /NCGR_PEP_ID=MMETSP0208-20121228/11250_1 /TAXON_ID=197538 /ORGANISM="Strombidium inclinatum, Strain S3" /LENGTH=128 /DNA_ID=CAMNT_0010767405 /DNA_START=11 /DNA_END=397 /DNA_ORIENTATION=-